MTWTIVDSGAACAADNMRLDLDFLMNLGACEHPILHLYEWSKEAATYGYFIKPQEYLDLECVKKRGFDLARRPTGGGVIFHTCDLAFSILVPSSHPNYSINPLDNYQYINGLVAIAIRKYLGHHTFPTLLPQERGAYSAVARQFCMAKPTKYDLMIEGRKLGGAAQRRMKQGFLHQGSIALSLVEEELIHDLLLHSDQIFPLMQSTTYPLLGREVISKNELKVAREEMKQILKEVVLNS